MQLACWSSALAIGIACGLALGRIALLLLAASLLVSLAMLSALRARNLAVVCLAGVAGLGLGSREAMLAAADPPVEEDKTVEVVGQVSGLTEAVSPASASPFAGPSPRSPPGPRWRLRIAVASIDGRPRSLSLALLVLAGPVDVKPGEWVRFATRLYLPRGYINPGLPDGRLQARAQGIDLSASVRDATELHRIDGHSGLLGYARCWAFRLRRAMGNAINRRLPEQTAGFVRTMVIGERSRVPESVESGFRAAGATHALSVSGLHLAVVVALVFQGFKWLVACLPGLALRVPPKVLASLLALPATWFYTLLTGEAVATVRAAVMASVVLCATLLNRPLSLAASIGAAAAVLLLPSPASLVDVSFQLSFASVIGLGLFARWMLPDGVGRKVGGWRRAPYWLLRSVSASTAAWLVTLPLVVHHFGEVTPAAPLGNLVLVPIVELAVLPLGFVGSLLALLHPSLGAPLLFVAGVSSQAVLCLAEGFRTWAPVLLVRFPNTGETVLLVASAGGLLRTLSTAGRGRRTWLAVGTLALVLAATSLLVGEVLRRTREELRVTFLDVGQGSAALVEGPRGFAALVDGGGRYDDSFDTGGRIVEPVLRAAGITRLDLVVLSHPHPDHLNGLLHILARFPVGALWTTGDDGANPKYAQLMTLAKERGVSTPPPGRLSRAGMVVEAVGPWMDDRVGVPPGLSVNDASLVVRLAYRGRHILLPGDIGEEGEQELLARRGTGLDLGADVLAVPHHGSRHASSAAFLGAVGPVTAVVSAGRWNRFGLPSRAALRRYADRNVLVLRTDQVGAVQARVRGSGSLTVLPAAVWQDGSIENASLVRP